MATPPARDRKRCLVLGVESTPAGAVVRVRTRHEDYHPDRPWSWCDVEVLLEDEQPVPPAGAEVELVLHSFVEEGRESELEGIYSCKVHPASYQPTQLYERERAGFYSGLIERDDQEAGGDVVLHMGSGLTCYARMVGAGVEPEEVRHGEWWEFRFTRPHRALLCEEVAAEAPAPVEPAAGVGGAPAERSEGGGLSRLLRGILGGGLGEEGRRNGRAR